MKHYKEELNFNTKEDNTYLLVFDEKRNKLTQFKNDGHPIGDQWRVIDATSEFITDCFCDLWQGIFEDQKHTIDSVQGEYSKFLISLEVIKQRATIYNKIGTKL